MKTSLQLKLGQSLTLAPQLQQAIKLLQLSSLELQAEIQDALESNMMLELDEEEGGDGSGESYSALKEAEGESTEPESLIKDDNIPEDLPFDTAWEDIYDGGGYSKSIGDAANYNGLEIRDPRDKTLREHLLSQLNLITATDSDIAIGVAIIDALNEDGYLSCDLEEILASIEGGIEESSIEEVEAVLHLIQSMDPPGVASRNVRECLLIQLKQLPSDTPWIDEARRIASSHLHLFAAHDYSSLLRRMELDAEQLKEPVALIQSMNPRPGRQFNQTSIEYIVPDVYVRKHNGIWRVDLHSGSMPNIRINRQYVTMIKRADNSRENTSLKTHLQEAKWFIKSLQSRSETLLKVASSIVARQRKFFEYGEEAMKPLVLHDIAEGLDMHESTISRVTTKKYMHTPRGIFELKYFFSSHVGTSFGGVCSSTAIRALIKKLIQGENAQAPLSDSKITKLLTEQGINVARRTVAKYRESMTILPSNERRRLV